MCQWDYPADSDGIPPLCLPDTGEHPIHFHGRTFWVLATSDFPEAEQLFAGNYVRRDVISVPAEGWAKIRFVADNPGTWVVHCHIGPWRDAERLLRKGAA